MREEWRDIPGFEGFYQASDSGRIRSIARTVRGVSKRGTTYSRPSPSRILSPGDCKGYDIVNLSVLGKPNMERVHRLVALAFLPGKPTEQVNHKDGDKRNNSASNLEWSNPQHNLNHAVSMGLNTQAVRVQHPLTGEVFASIARASRVSGSCEATISKRWIRV